MAGEPIVARTAWSKGGTTYVTIRWNGAVRTRVASPDGSGGWTITLPGLGETAVILPATIGTEPTEGRLARPTMAARLAAGDNAPPPGRRNGPWQDLSPTSASSRAPHERGEAHIVTFSPPPASAPATRGDETRARLAAETEQRRSEAQAEWRRIEEERRRLERERQELEEQRRLLAAASKPVPVPPPPITVDEDLPAWLAELPAPDRYVFQHLADHGSINEPEATRLLGGARQFRRFSGQLEEHLARVPFKVRIEVAGGLKCYVRDERGTE